MTKTRAPAKAAPAPMTEEQKAAFAAEFQKHLNEQAIKDAGDWMDNLIATVESNVRDLKRYRQSFADSLTNGSDGFVKPVEVMSWFINQTQSLPTNLRLDMVPRLAVALAKATDKA